MLPATLQSFSLVLSCGTPTSSGPWQHPESGSRSRVGKGGTGRAGALGEAVLVLLLLQYAAYNQNSCPSSFPSTISSHRLSMFTELRGLDSQVVVATGASQVEAW